MKKTLLLILGIIFSSLYSQNYCIPNFAFGCNNGDNIDSFQIPAASFSHLNTSCSTGSYGDFTAEIINLNAGVGYEFSITH